MQSFHCIITKDGKALYVPKSNIIHDEIVKRNRLCWNDDVRRWIRITFYPKDKESFNLNPDNWKMKVMMIDNEMPEWFERNFSLYRDNARMALNSFLKNRKKQHAL